MFDRPLVLAVSLKTTDVAAIAATDEICRPEPWLRGMVAERLGERHRLARHQGLFERELARWGGVNLRYAGCTAADRSAAVAIGSLTIDRLPR